ncbi:secreted RxLR effector protein 161-like [Benincasa hispida]|uniref:secreted RxLR effector protein 161-like n=1 Tax=Benincasa hispida TaxID=102211 RepID=UPI0019008C67|nr:secreted RxLR effector protein 161-like [Benincasa hispida]
MLQKYGLENASPKHTPAPTHAKLGKGLNAANFDESLYRSMIRSFLYLTANRPGIAYVTRVYARYQSNPKTSHLENVKRIFKYISSIVECGLLYCFDTNGVIIGYCDADWAGNFEDRKSSSEDENMFQEYDVAQDVMTLYYDNMSAINISKNSV